jgi:hypothetical protein
MQPSTSVQLLLPMQKSGLSGLYLPPYSTTPSNPLGYTVCAVLRQTSQPKLELSSACLKIGVYQSALVAGINNGDMVFRTTEMASGVVTLDATTSYDPDVNINLIPLGRDPNIV